jgi:hypothetical protein
MSGMETPMRPLATSMVIHCSRKRCLPQRRPNCRIATCAGTYIDKGDLILCKAWSYVGTYPISGAEQKVCCFWRRIVFYFHEDRKVKPDNFESDRNDLSLQKGGASSNRSATDFVVLSRT